MPKELLTGPKGGQYWKTSTGLKIYVGAAGGAAAAPAAPKGPKVLQTGAKGGQYWVTSTGLKIYVGNKGKGDAAAAPPAAGEPKLPAPAAAGEAPAAASDAPAEPTRTVRMWVHKTKDSKGGMQNFDSGTLAKQFLAKGYKSGDDLYTRLRNGAMKKEDAAHVARLAFPGWKPGAKGDAAAPPPAKLPAAPPAPKPAAAPLSASAILHEKTKDATGSNKGGFYKGSDGKDRYVKFYSDPAQAAGEHLANTLYRAAGLGAPKSQLFEHEGKVAYASEIIPDVKTFKDSGSISADMAKKAMHGFTADVLTGNWDAAGTGHDNMATDKDGNVHRIDNGGSFLSRAQGARKPEHLLTQVTELEKFLDHGKNPYYAEVANKAGVHDKDEAQALVKQQLPALLKVRDEAGGWKGFVDKNAPLMPEADRKQVVNMLETRSKLLQDFASAPPKPKTMSQDEVHKKLLSAFGNSWKNKLTATHKSAIQSYTGMGYSEINDALRKGTKLDDHLEKKVKALDEALKPPPGAPFDMTVHRGLILPKDVLDKLQVGKVWGDNAYMSTSVGHGFSGSVKLHIAVPKGSGGAYVQTISNHKGEKEWLLPRHTLLKVIKREQLGGHVEIYAEAIAS